VKLSWRATALEALFGTLCARSGVSPSAGVVFWPFFGLRPKLKVALMSFSMTFSKESFHKSDFSANEFLTSCPRYPVGAPVNLSSSAWGLESSNFSKRKAFYGGRVLEKA
jgi:hypothetical protein